MRHVAEDFGVHVSGVTIVPYQVARGRLLSARAGLADRCNFVLGDFNRLEFPTSSFDAVYTIEACCHAADRRNPFAEAFRVLRPGARFAGYDWCLLDSFNPADPDHVRIKEGIEQGNGIAELRPASDVLDSLLDAGFEVEACGDWAATAHPRAPWYGYDLGVWAEEFRELADLGEQGRFDEAAARLMGRTRRVERGAATAQAVVPSGRRASGHLTPSFFWVARKPGDEPAAVGGSVHQSSRGVGISTAFAPFGPGGGARARHGSWRGMSQGCSGNDDAGRRPLLWPRRRRRMSTPAAIA
jgi:sterol 24-C-methyltransferase